MAGAAMLERVGGYRVVRSLGRGPMGETFLAQGEMDDVRVVIKVCDPKAVATLPFLSLCTRSDLKDPFVLSYREIRPDPRYRELLISDFLDVRPLSPAAFHGVHLDGRIARLADLADALHRLAEKKMVHGNIKPSNVLVRFRGGYQPILADLGLRYCYAKDTFDDGSVPRVVPYMAPEILDAFLKTKLGQVYEATVPGDVYAFAATLAEGLTGQVPFLFQVSRQPSVDEIRKAKESKKYRIIVKNDPSTPLAVGDLNGLVERCLAPHPGDRPRSFKELADGLRTCLRAPPPAAEKR